MEVIESSHIEADAETGDWLPVTVCESVKLTPDTLLLRLRSATGAPLPLYEPGAHVALKHDAPVPAARQEHEMTDRNDAVSTGALQHHAVLNRHQRDRKVFIRLREGTNALRARGHAR